MTGQRDAATAFHRSFAEPVRLDLADPGTLQHRRDLQRTSYAVEARLIGLRPHPAPARARVPREGHASGDYNICMAQLNGGLFGDWD
ncbi:hypothetical protein ACLQ18_31350 [Streptomyces sp. DT193]|uniref:hypothetical protein n=1 Tax=Streptomyces sp. DT193 TaxID=3393418 RepID=UPI003CFA57CF